MIPKIPTIKPPRHRRPRRQAPRAVRLRRQLSRGGGRWTSLETLGHVTDCDRWRIVVELGHWAHRIRRVRLKKYRPSGRFYFCEGLTLSLEAWTALRRLLPCQPSAFARPTIRR